MTDIVLVALIASVPATIASVTGVINVTLAIVHDRRSNIRKDALDVKISKTQSDVAKVEKNTNGMNAAMLKVTGESERAIGNLEGHAAEKENPTGPS